MSTGGDHTVCMPCKDSKPALHYCREIKLDNGLVALLISKSM